MVVKEFAKLRALRALVPCVLRVLHALVPHVSHVPGALRALVPHVPRAIRALMPYVPRSICALVPYVLSCLTYSRALRALVHCALRIFVSHLSYVLLYLTCLSLCMFSGCSWLGLYGPLCSWIRTVLLHHRFYSILLKYFTSERGIHWIPCQIYDGALCDKLVWSNRKLLSQKAPL